MCYMSHIFIPQQNLKRNISAFWKPGFLGILLLLLALGIGTTVLYLGVFGDEGDNIAVGLFISKGKVLYRDIFSHHFPFAYFWTAVVFSLFGPSVIALRLSVMIFQIVSFALVMRLTRLYLPVGLAALTWSLIGHFYFGNMAIYHMFSGIAISIIFLETFAITFGYIRADRDTMILAGGYSLIAILADPLTVLPVSIAILVLSFSAAGVRRSFWAILILGIGIASYLLYLWITGSLDDFWRDVIIFNREIYDKYYSTNFSRLLRTLVDKTIGLDILESTMWLNPNISPSINRLTPFGQWYLGGFFYRLAIIMTTITLLLKRRVLTATFVYFFTASLLVRSEVFFYTIGFVIVALLASSWLFLIMIRTRSVSEKMEGENTISRLLGNLFAGVIALSLGWLMISGFLSILENRNRLSYAANFGIYEKMGVDIRTMVCNQDTMLGIYPGDPILYLYTGMEPVSRYVIMYPWVAELALQEVIDSLLPEQQVKAIIYVDRDGSIWGRKNLNYLGELIAFLDKNYVEAEPNYYRSPSLIEACDWVNQLN